MKKVLTLIAISAIISGCSSAAMTGASAAYDRYSISQNIHDSTIAHTANNRIYHQVKMNSPSNIAINSANGYVLLAGQVPSEKVKLEAGQVTARVEGVKKVYNFLEVQKPVSFKTHLSDTIISNEIKTRFITDKLIDPSAIDVYTENGVVFLQGNVTPQMSAEAAKVAGSIRGVTEVVKIFQYVHLSPTPEVSTNKTVAANKATAKHKA